MGKWVWGRCGGTWVRHVNNFVLVEKEIWYSRFLWLGYFTQQHVGRLPILFLHFFDWWTIKEPKEPLRNDRTKLLPEPANLLLLPYFLATLSMVDFGWIESTSLPRTFQLTLRQDLHRHTDYSASNFLAKRALHCQINCPHLPKVKVAVPPRISCSYSINCRRNPENIINKCSKYKR